MSNRVDELLAALLNGETADITPQSRVEALLKALIDGAGTEGLPAPQSSMEAYLLALVEKGMGGGGSGGGDTLFAQYLSHETGLSLFQNHRGMTDNELGMLAPLISQKHLTECDYMFEHCEEITSIPRLDTSGATSGRSMFRGCKKLISIPEIDTGKMTAHNSFFSDCYSLASVPQLNTSASNYLSNMFQNCQVLTSIPTIDARNADYLSSMFHNCKLLTACVVRNIKVNLQVGSGETWGHLLTVDSLVRLIYELRDTGSMKTLTIGTANLSKLTDTYVLPVDITDEMRTEDDLIDEKLPFEVVDESTEGRIPISDYVSMKNWKLA